MAENIPAYLTDPPVYDNVLEEIDKRLNDSWSNWFDSVVDSMGQCITNDVIVDVDMNRFDVAILMATGGTTVQRNQLENARDGDIWYNTDTTQFNFRQNGTWVTFTPIPA